MSSRFPVGAEETTIGEGFGVGEELTLGAMVGLGVGLETVVGLKVASGNGLLKTTNAESAKATIRRGIRWTTPFIK